MDPEQTFLRVHARVSGMLSQLLTPRIRTALEYLYLSVAVALFALLVVMHTNFVQQPGCSSQLSGVEIADAQLVQIKISSVGLWSSDGAGQNVMASEIKMRSADNMKTLDANADGFTISAARFLSTWITSGAKRNKLNFKSWKGDKEILDHQVEGGGGNAMPTTVSDVSQNTDHSNAQVEELKEIVFHTSEQDSFGTSIIDFYKKWRNRVFSVWRTIRQLPATASQLRNIAGLRELKDIPKSLQTLHPNWISSYIVQWLEKGSKMLDPTYLYTIEKGYFLLPEVAKARHNVLTVNVSIPANHTCFGNRWQQLLINRFVGYDTILMNSLLSSPGPGYLYNFQTKEFYDLSYGPESTEGQSRFGDYFVTKCSVLLMSLFVFFTTTMSVSFTLRETQSRMLKFTVQLQHHARHHLPTFQLIFVHVIESLVFVPIMIGILFFLFEFYDDQLLAFLVLTLVWLCELFTMISVRTPISMQFFPRFFLLYFLVFHIYFFSYAYGFSYLAFCTTAAFMQHLILFFWNRYEVPALQRFMRNRTQLQQQTGVQITSSTILTSTLHIARVDVRNPNSNVDNESVNEAPTTAPSPVEAAGNIAQAATGSADSSEGTGHLSESNAQQTNTSPSSTSLNPFGSLLLWILGGASSDGIVSFFSLFRDLREQDHVYVQPPQDGNEPET